MDPDANLKEMRELSAWLDGSHSGDEECARRSHRLAELVKAMDEWLSEGSALPEAWRR